MTTFAYPTALTAMALALAFSACTQGNGTNPITTGRDRTVTVGSLPGTQNPTANTSIERYETEGQADAVSYDSTTDTFTVDNLPFDGNDVYDRDDQVMTLNTFRVYENNNVAPHRQYKALYIEGATTRVAVIRTGDYLDYGFGGFLYARNGAVSLPTGQATYTGQYAGLRVFENRSGIQYTQADIDLDVDFDDFITDGAVEGFLTNRRIIDPTTGADLGPVEADGASLTFLTGAISEAGEVAGTVGSLRTDMGIPEDFEQGEYYAVIGDNGNEIAGVLVMTANDPDLTITTDDDVNIQETGGFYLLKNP